MKNTSYENNNVENYALYLINNGLQVGSTIKRNHGSFKAGNEIYEVTEITEETIKAVCVEVINPRIDQQRRMNKIIGSGITINISECGSFPKYVKA